MAGLVRAWVWTPPTCTADGYQDLFVSNVDHEMYSVYINNKDESFADAAQTKAWRAAPG